MVERQITFTTANLFNLCAVGQRTYGDAPPYPDNAEGVRNYRTRIQWLGDALRAFQADVMAFQEVWSAAALTDVLDRAGLTVSHAVLARDAPGRGRPQVAAAVRKELLSDPGGWQESFPDSFRLAGIRELHGAREAIDVRLSRFSRPLLWFVLDPPDTRPRNLPVSVIVAHLKSKGPARIASALDDRDGDGRPDRPPILREHAAIAASCASHLRRVLEAGALRAYLDMFMKGREPTQLSPVVVLGDLNDDTLSTTTELVAGAARYRLFSASRRGGESGAGLYSVEALQQYRSLRHVYYTYIFENKPGSLDHVLVSEEFYDHSKKRRWSFQNIEILNDHLGYGDESRAQREARMTETGISDHGFVRALFNWDPAPGTEDIPDEEVVVATAADIFRPGV